MRMMLLAVLVLLAYPISISAAAVSIKGNVVSVSSGNLISFQDESGEIRQVSLYGIDSPDGEQKMGQHAHRMLSAMVGDKAVDVKLDEAGSEGVPSAHISLNGLSINAAMVKSGCAWVNPETCKSSNCSSWREYQQYAKKKKKGLWVDPEAEPPWEWRERRSKAEAIARKLNAESDFVTYYGSLAESGHRSLWAKRTLPSGPSFSGTVAQSGNGTAMRASSGSSRSKARAGSGSSSKSPGPRRG